MCCNGNTEGTRSQGNTAGLAACFENPATLKIGAARFYWDLRVKSPRTLSACAKGKYVANLGERKYTEDRKCENCESGSFSDGKCWDACDVAFPGHPPS